MGHFDQSAVVCFRTLLHRRTRLLETRSADGRLRLLARRVSVSIGVPVRDQAAVRERVRFGAVDLFGTSSLVLSRAHLSAWERER